MTREEYDIFSYTNAYNLFPGHENMTYSWFMQQHGEEFWLLLEKFQACNPKRILEIGSSHGGTLPFFSKLVGKDGLVIGLDFGKTIESGAFSAITRSSHPEDFTNIKYLLSDSHNGNTIEKINQLFNYLPIDCLFIDGDHSYNGAKQDFEMYRPLVKPGGVIGFHDVEIEPGIKKLFGEISLPKELLKVYYMGIGIVYV